MGRPDPDDLQVEGPLAVREEGDAFLVVRADDPEDWLARFEKGEGFPARAWAENMAEVYNRRLRDRSTQHPRPEPGGPSRR